MPDEDNFLAAERGPRYFRAADATRFAPPTPRLFDGAAGHVVRFAARALSTAQAEGLVRSAYATSNGTSAAEVPWRLAADEGADHGGFDAAPSAAALFAAGALASIADEFAALAARRGVDFGTFEIALDMIGGPDAAAPEHDGSREMALGLRVAGAAPLDLARTLLLEAVVAAPAGALLREAAPSRFAPSGDQRAAAASVEPIAAIRAEMPDLAGLAPAVGDWSLLLARQAGRLRDPVETGVAPEPMRATCRREPDGLKRLWVDARQPGGAAYAMLCDAPAALGGLGRAPDPLGYVAAGLGLSLIAEIARTARAWGRPLGAIEIVQDLHVSRGGATGDVNRPAVAAPVETSVRLPQLEEDETATHLLAVRATRAAPPHVLCASTVRFRARVSRRSSA